MKGYDIGLWRRHERGSRPSSANKDQAPRGQDDVSLGELGEARIRDELILPRLVAPRDTIVGPGDDAAVIAFPETQGNLVFTTDPCPYPVANLVGDPDLYYAGWLTVLINVSDLGAMGAAPLGMLISLTMPEDMLKSDLARFYDGAVSAATRWSCPILGGNIKDATEFTATGSAIGVVSEGQVMRRSGAAPGDVICVFGEIGLFWSAVISRLLRLESSVAEFTDALNDALFHPTPKIEAAIRLARTGVAHAATDASDGLGAALRDIAAASEVDIELQTIPTSDPARTVASLASMDARNLALAWGDWQLVAAVPPQGLDDARAAAQSAGTTFSEVGIVRPGTGRVVAADASGVVRPVRLFSSERFTRSSYFTHGLEAYLQMLKEPFFA